MLYKMHYIKFKIKNFVSIFLNKCATVVLTSKRVLGHNVNESTVL